MTVLDKSVPYYPVVMILEKECPYKEVSMAEGYHFIQYDDSYKDAWIKLHVTLGQLESYEKGLQYFKETFEPHMEDVKKQFLLVVDKDGKLAGTSSVWAGHHFGVERLRVHWVGVDPNHQRKGIAKALMIETIALYASLHKQEPLYLTTQTNSYVAIQLYLQLGFVPYMGTMPKGMQVDLEEWKRDNITAWDIIHKLLK